MGCNAHLGNQTRVEHPLERMKMKKIRMIIKPDTIKSLAVKDSKGTPIAYISVSGKNLMISTEGWSDCTVEDITNIEELA